MKSAAFPDKNDAVGLDLALSIGGTFRNWPEKSTPSGSSFSGGDGEERGITDAKNRGQIRRREEPDEEDERNPPLKREKKLQGVESDCRNKPAVKMPYSFSSLQFVPFPNGYAIPCKRPYWAAGAAAVVGRGGVKTLHQPVACRSFRKIESCGSSPVCSSSVISDNYQSSSSHDGGGSSYTRSNSSNSSSDRQRMPCPSPNSNDTMNHDKPEPCRENMTQCGEKFVESHASEIKKESIMASNKDEAVVPSSKSVSNSLPFPSMSMKNMKIENGKPPDPQIQRQNVPSLRQMPCVTTTGVGPNGRTITGFLYRYSNLEVSIVCVCHGESFSPAEFVKHAGGGEISHPLRHITVLPTNGIPSAIR